MYVMADMLWLLSSKNDLTGAATQVRMTLNAKQYIIIIAQAQLRLKTVNQHHQDSIFTLFIQLFPIVTMATWWHLNSSAGI